MGDRGNIVIVEENGGTLFLYSHWGGTELPSVLKAALRRGESRWGDEPYLSRIIFSELVKDSILDEGDNSHDHVRVLMSDQAVEIGSRRWTFQDFVSSGPDTL